MAYADWEFDFTAKTAGQPAREAQLCNLRGESRIAKSRGLFKRSLGLMHKKMLASLPAGDAAVAACDAMAGQSRVLNSRWLGRLPGPNGGGPVPGRTVTHLPLQDIVRYHSSVFVPTRGATPRRNLRLDRPPKTRVTASGPEAVCRFIWVTFAPTGTSLPDDPALTVSEFGLAHYPSGPGQYVYRCEIDITGKHTYIPTCLDAGLYEAWAPPPPGHPSPWGTTRDLVTGAARWPELLTETADHLGARPHATLVSPPTATQHVNSVTPNYMANR